MGLHDNEIDAARRGFVRKLAEQIKARSQVSATDDEKELRRQMRHITGLADLILEDC